MEQDNATARGRFEELFDAHYAELRPVVVTTVPSCLARPTPPGQTPN